MPLWPHSHLKRTSIVPYEKVRSINFVGSLQGKDLSCLSYDVCKDEIISFIKGFDQYEHLGKLKHNQAEWNCGIDAYDKLYSMKGTIPIFIQALSSYEKENIHLPEYIKLLEKLSNPTCNKNDLSPFHLELYKKFVGE